MSTEPTFRTTDQPFVKKIELAPKNSPEHNSQITLLWRKFTHKVDLSHGFSLVKKWKYMPLNPKCEKKIKIRLVPKKVFGKH